jgi:uncharacterized membrane protein YwzB
MLLRLFRKQEATIAIIIIIIIITISFWTLASAYAASSLLDRAIGTC